MKNILIGIVMVLLVVGAFYHFFVKPNQIFSGTAFSCQVPLFAGVGTASSTTVTTGNNMVLATSSVRNYVIIRNTGASAVSLNFGDAAVAGKGYYLSPTTTLEVSPCGPLYTKNSIQATMEGGAGSAVLQLWFKHVAE